MLFSIIIPAYNVEKYLEKCVKSIADQNQDDYEMILVDDGSTDLTPVICDNLKNIYSQIKVIHKQNGGVSSARNAGIDIATGKYLIFIDSDDYISDNFFAVICNILDRFHEIDLICYSYDRVYENTTIMQQRSYNVNRISNIEAYKEYSLSRKISRMAWDKVYKAKLFKDIRFPVGLLAEDYATTYKILAKSKNIVWTDARLYRYVQRENSITAVKSEKLLLDTYNIGNDEYIFGISNYKKLKKEIYSNYIKLLMMTSMRLHKYGYYPEMKEVCDQCYTRLSKMIFAITGVKVKAMQILFLIWNNFALMILSKHEDS